MKKLIDVSRVDFTNKLSEVYKEAGISLLSMEPITSERGEYIKCTFKHYDDCYINVTASNERGMIKDVYKALMIKEAYKR